MANHQQLISDSDESSEEEMDINMRKLRARTTRTTEHICCLPVDIPENIKAYINNWKLERHVKEIDCNKDVIEKVFNNYVIIKNIMSQLPWQDKVVCKRVSTLWDSAIQTLQKEQLEPVDFSIKIGHNYKLDGVEMKQSAEFSNVPLVVFVFYNNACDDFSCAECHLISPIACKPPCKNHHSILDYIYKKCAAPKPALFAAKCLNIAYLPLPLTPTYDNAVTRLLRGSQALYSGLYIPAIQGVKFITVNMATVADKQSVISKLTKISKEYVIKGVIVQLTDNYTLYTNQQEAVIVNCLHHLGTLQPDIPFALGGCLVEDSINSESDIKKHINCINYHKNFITGNQMTLGIFAVPKNIAEKPSFDMFSCVIDSAEWSKDKILEAIQEFAHNIPRYEFSIVLKLSCSGRHQKHELEQSYFRTLFPYSRIIGCFGNGELGVNHPPRRKNNSDQDAKKRPRTEVQYEKVHSYSTVFVYIGWGKIFVPVEMPKPKPKPAPNPKPAPTPKSVAASPPAPPTA